MQWESLNRFAPTRGLQRDVVYLCWPIAPSYYESKCGGREGVAGSQPMSTAVHITWHGAQINSGDLPPYLTYGSNLTGSPTCAYIVHITTGYLCDSGLRTYWTYGLAWGLRPPPPPPVGELVRGLCKTMSGGTVSRPKPHRTTVFQLELVCKLYIPI